MLPNIKIDQTQSRFVWDILIYTDSRQKS